MTTHPRTPGRRAAAIGLLPAAYVPMTPEQEERAVEALAGALIEVEERRRRDGRQAQPAS